MAAQSPGAPAPAPARKPVDSTMIMPRGVSLGELEKGGKPPGFDTNKSFSKKTNKVNKFFLIGGILVGLLIVGLIVYSLDESQFPQLNPCGHETALFKKRNHAMTLVEVLVVIAVLMIIAVIILASISELRIVARCTNSVASTI